MNPHADQARAQSREWARGQGLIGAGGWDAGRFDGIDLAGLCAWTHPDAPVSRLTLVTLWYLWLYFVDDFYTESVVAPGGLSQRVAIALWAQTEPLMSADWCARFAESTLRVVEEHSYELAHSVAARVPSPLEYAVMRHRGDNGTWAAELVELADTVPLPPVMAHSPALRNVLDCFNDILRLHNDIVSYNRETQQEHEVNNGVLVVQTASGCSPQQAAETVNETLTMRVRQFEHATTVDMPAAVETHRLDAAERETVTRYINGLKDYLAGYYIWHAASTRDAPADTGGRSTASASTSRSVLRGPTGFGTSAARITPPRQNQDANAPQTPPPRETPGAAARMPFPRLFRFNLRERTLRLAARVASSFDDRGALPERSASRVLESTIMLALLRRTQRYPKTQAGLMRFIAARYADPDLNPVERLLAEASLGLTADPEGTRDPFEGFAHHSSGRKRLMVGTYLDD